MVIASFCCGSCCCFSLVHYTLCQRLACHQKNWQESMYVLIQWLLGNTPLFLAHSSSKSWLVYFRTWDKNWIDALWCLCLWHNRGSEWFSPPGDYGKHSLQAAVSLVCLMAKAVSKHTRCVPSLQSTCSVCLLILPSLICVKVDQMLLKDHQMHLNGKTQVYLSAQNKKRKEKRKSSNATTQKQKESVSEVMLCFCFHLALKEIKCW